MDFRNNSQLKLAYDFVRWTDKNIFLTGKAGTGKTTFLHYLRETLPKRLVVVAPTGVAAINASGVTIHSFFQLTPGLQYNVLDNPVSGAAEKPEKINRFNREKRNIIKSMELLVIDEISMVRADLLDAVDMTLRRFRYKSEPFGGVQLLLIGDLQQLAPVAKDDEWELLRKQYDTPFFFSSKALSQSDYVTIELQHVYRQKDEGFIGLLNKIRENRFDNEVLEKLNRHYRPGFDPDDKEGYVLLTTHNYKAKQVNESKLAALKGKKFSYTATVNGNFPEGNFPTDETLTLKTGAQVMFVKNDPDPAKRYFNGKIGVVKELSDKWVKVQCPGEEEPILVTPLEWKRLKYALDEETKEIRESVEGTFVQIPLKTAWAITIHKSQGLTFDKVVIDAGAAFTHGQVYVALSRCTSPEGIVLTSRLTPDAVFKDFRLDNFNRKIEENPPDDRLLQSARREYQEKLITGLFDFTRLQTHLRYLRKQGREHAGSLSPSFYEEAASLERKVSENITEVGEKFRKQLSRLLAAADDDVEKDEKINERLKKASVYFLEKLKSELTEQIERLDTETDNKQVKKSLKNTLERIEEELRVKEACLRVCENGFRMRNFLEAKSKAVIVETTVKRKKKKTDLLDSEVQGVEHPALYNLLRSWRNQKAGELGWEHYKILPLQTLRELSMIMPGSLKALSTVKGMGKKRIDTFGEEIVGIILKFCEENQLEPFQYTAPKKKSKKKTRDITFELWNQGKSIEEIADQRGLTTGTIANHLRYFVSDGKLPVDKVVEMSKLLKIASYYNSYPNATLTEVKEALDSDISFDEIGFVRAHLVYKKVLSNGTDGKD